MLMNGVLVTLTNGVHLHWVLTTASTGTPQRMWACIMGLQARGGQGLGSVVLWIIWGAFKLSLATVSKSLITVTTRDAMHQGHGDAGETRYRIAIH